MQTSTLDDVTAHLDGPIFLKLDVQGAEVEVLDGGSKTLDRSDLVQLEVALLPYNEGGATFLQVINYMDQRGFVPFDVAGMIRPTGAELVQVDMLFVPSWIAFTSNPLRLSPVTAALLVLTRDPMLDPRAERGA